MRVRSAGVAAALALHAGLLLIVSAALHRNAAPRHDTPAVQVRLLAPWSDAAHAEASPPTPSSTRPQPKSAAERQPGGDATTTSARWQAAEETLAVDEAGASAKAASPEAASSSASSPAAAPATTPASAPGSMLESDATRQAISQAARTPTRGISTGKLRPEERLGREMEQAAVGNCAKGEYVGGGMGVLSVPFWVAAQMRDKCRR